MTIQMLDGSTVECRSVHQMQIERALRQKIDLRDACECDMLELPCNSEEFKMRERMARRLSHEIRVLMSKIGA